MENRMFNKGDFVKYKTYSDSTTKVTFGIFEGVDLAPEYQYTKKLSLAAYYDSYKYSNNLNNGIGWGYAPFLEVAEKDKPCEKTIDTYEEDNWWSLCTEEEKENALVILESYGYKWDEESMSIIDMKTGEIVHKIITPKLEYNGETIKPICDEFKYRLKESIMSKNPPSYNNNSNYHYHNCYGYNGYDPYDAENWD